MFGQKLRELRDRAGLTQQQVCERTGLTMDGLSKLERGLRQPAWETVQKLADALGFSCEDFRAGDEQAAESPTPKPGPGRPRKAPPAGEGPAEGEAKKPARKGRKGD